MNVVAANFNQCSSVRFVPFGFVLQQQDPATKNHGHNHATRRGREESVHFATLQMRKEVSLHGFPQITYLFFQLLSVVLFHNSFLHHQKLRHDLTRGVAALGEVPEFCIKMIRFVMRGVLPLQLLAAKHTLIELCPS